MASVATVDFVETSRPVQAPPFSLIEQKGLVKRLGEELTRAASELSRDPSAFLRGLFFSDDRDKKRRRLICAGLALGLVAQFVFLAFAAIAGLHRMLAPVKEEPPQITMVNPRMQSPDTASEKPPGRKDGGGGGGGQLNPAPASKGPLPQSVPQPQLVSLNPSNIPEPTLAIAPTIKGLESAPPPPVQVGDPKGKASEFSGGPGSGGGIGDKSGTGVGPGYGPGGGPGSKGGKGGGPAGYPSVLAANASEIDYGKLASIPSSLPAKIISSPRPVVTPEAQSNKVSGVVLLRATFNADGTITDIEVVMGVDHMTESAIESVRRSKIRPATINGQPVTVRRVPVRVAVNYDSR